MNVESYVGEFLIESHENLDHLDQEFVALEKDPANRERLSKVFRTIHTIKGMCGFFGFEKLQSVAHAGESLLSLLRNGVMTFTPQVAGVLLETVDAIRVFLRTIEQTGQEGDADFSALVQKLDDLSRTVPIKAATLAPAPVPPPAPSAELSANTLVVRPMNPRTTSAVSVPPSVSVPPPVPAPAPTLKPDSIQMTLPAADPLASAQAVESSIRVDVGLLDKLMTLVGELVLARNQIVQCATAQKDPTLQTTTQRLNQITSELQENVMKTRMQPISNVWSRFPRLVRDLAVSCGREVRLEMHGQDTDLDRTILDAIKDPLTHMVRNAIDHGIEPPEERIRAGKPAIGRLELRSYHEGGQVNIEITDDGRGMDPAVIRRKGIERGILTAEQAARISDRDVLQLVFLPGFSTAAAVTNVSGRGVGMDVVKTNIERVGGSLELRSTVGEGTTLKVRIPLTLAIIPALIVTCGSERYAIPQVNLLEVVGLDPTIPGLGVEYVHSTPVYRLRGTLLPVVDLRREFGVKSKPVEADGLTLVVLMAGERQFGLIVEGVRDTEEIVVKPLHKLVQGIGVLAGATIMGDGRVALILDIPGLAQQTGVVAAGGDARRPAQPTTAVTPAMPANGTLALVEVGGRRLAIPLTAVARLEEFPRGAVELSAGRHVVQYRDRILPLLSLSEEMGLGAGDWLADPAPVVVCGERGEIGLAVDRILDIVESPPPVEAPNRPGIIGAIVVQGRVTDVLDVAAVLRPAIASGRAS